MGKRKQIDFWDSASKNKREYIMYFNRLEEIAISMFSWTNLPDTIDPRFLEKCLFGDGMCVFFKDEELGFLALRCMIGGKLNVYQIPTERTAFASNGYHRYLDNTNSVIIFNNMIHTNTVMDVDNYARRIWDLDCAIDVNAKAQKTPVLLSCDQNQRLTLLNAYEQFTGNQPVIYADKNLNPNSIKVMKTDAPYVADKLQTLKTQIWNDAMTFLGVSNVSFQKKERMLSSEISSSMGDIVASRYSRMNARKQAAEEINRMFNLDISVDFRADYVDMQLDDNITEEEETIYE